MEIDPSFFTVLVGIANVSAGASFVAVHVVGGIWLGPRAISTSPRL